MMLQDDLKTLQKQLHYFEKISLRLVIIMIIKNRYSFM